MPNNDNDEGYPLTPGQKALLPDYLNIFCSPFIDGNDQINIKLPLSSELLAAMQIYYKMKMPPSYEQATRLIEKEIRDFTKKIM